MKITARFPDILRTDNAELLLPVVGDLEVIDSKNIPGLDKPCPSIVVGDENDTINLLGTFSHPKVQHFVQIARTDFLREIITSSLMLKRSEQFFVNPIPFFVSNYTGRLDYQKEFRQASFTLKSTDEKNQLLENLINFLGKTISTKPVWQSVALITDEMITNAFFHAPVDRGETPLFQHMPRNSKVKLTSGHVRFFIAHDHRRLIVGCEDPFGSFDRPTLLQKLRRAYSGEPSEVEKTGAGAGLGCKMIIDRSIGFCVMSRKHVKSSVFAVLELGKGELEIQNTPKNIHLCFW
jgi:hypothetical protein